MQGRLTDYSSKEIVLDGKRVSYLDEGRGKVLLLVQGWVGSKEMFIPLIDSLKTEFRLVARIYRALGCRRN